MLKRQAERLRNLADIMPQFPSQRATMDSNLIASRNVECFLKILQTPDMELDTAGTMQKLLAEEENKLGRNREELELAERRVREGWERVKRLKHLVAASRFDDEGRQRALTFLATMEKDANAA